MAAFKTGDKVSLITRSVTPEDEKSGMYYTYFGGLTGVVDRVYDDGSVCIDVDLESLPQDTRDRHKAMEDAERQRWLDSLSNEVRNRLTAEQKQLKMSYKILVLQKDLEPNKGGGKPKGTKQSAEAAQGSEESPSSDQKGPARAPEPEAAEKPASKPAAGPAKSKEEESSAKRVSEAELSAAEEEYLKSIIKNMNV